VISVWLIWRFRNEIARALKDLLAQLLELWQSLFGARERQPGSLAADDLNEPIVVAMPFSSFRNPFAAGNGERVPLGELVTYTFRALEAWAREQGRARPAEQTPLEFAQMLAGAAPAVEAQDVCDYYCRLAYGNGQLPRRARETVQRLWEEMENTNSKR